jgi:hypothetical protein
MPQPELPFTSLVGRMKAVGVLPQDATPEEELEGIEALYAKRGSPPEVTAAKLEQARAERAPIHQFNAEANEQQRIREKWGPEAEQRFMHNQVVSRGEGDLGVVSQAANWLANRASTAYDTVDREATALAGVLPFEGLGMVGPEMVAKEMDRLDRQRATRGANVQGTAANVADMAATFVPMIRAKGTQLAGQLFGLGAANAYDAGHTSPGEMRTAGATETAVGLATMGLGTKLGKAGGRVLAPYAPRTAPFVGTAVGDAAMGLGTVGGQSAAGYMLDDQEMMAAPWRNVGEAVGASTILGLLMRGRGNLREGLANRREFAYRDPIGPEMPPVYVSPEVAPPLFEPIPTFTSVEAPAGPRTLTGEPIIVTGPVVEPPRLDLPEVVPALPGEGTVLRQLPAVSAPEVPATRPRSFPRATGVELPPIRSADPMPGEPLLGPVKAGPKAAEVPVGEVEMPMVEPVPGNPLPGPVKATPKNTGAQAGKVEMPVLPDIASVKSGPSQEAHNVPTNRAPPTEVRPAADTAPAPVEAPAPEVAPTKPTAPEPAVKPGQRVDVLDPTGKVAARGELLMAVNQAEGTAVIQSRATGKSKVVGLDRVAPTTRPAGELRPGTTKPQTVEPAPTEPPLPPVPERAEWEVAKAEAKPAETPKAKRTLTPEPDPALAEMNAEQAAREAQAAERYAKAQDFLSKRRGGMSRRGSVTLGGSIFGGHVNLGENIDLGAAAVKGAKAVGRAVGAGINRGLRMLHEDTLQGLERSGATEASTRGRAALQTGANLMTDKAVREAEKATQIKAGETREIEAALRTQAPEGGRGWAESPLAAAIQGRRSLESMGPAARRIVSNLWNFHKSSAKWGEGVEGMHGGTPNGKVLLHQYGNGLRRLLNLGSKTQEDPAFTAFNEDLAARYNKSPQEMREFLLGELKTTMEMGEGAITKSALEQQRMLKDLPDAWYYEGKEYRLLDISPNTYVKFHGTKQAYRIGFVKEFGPNVDPVNPVLSGEGVTAGQQEAFKKFVQSFHGKDWDRKVTTAITGFMDKATRSPGEYDFGKIADVTAEVLHHAVRVKKAALLTMNPLTTGTSMVPHAVAKLGMGPTLEATLRMARGKGVKNVADIGYLPEFIQTFGDVNRYRAAANSVVETLGYVTKRADRAAATWFANIAHVSAEHMKAGRNQDFNRRMLNSLGYDSKLVDTLATGKGTEGQYKQFVRDTVSAMTGIGANKATAGVVGRSGILRSNLPFTSFMDSQMRQFTKSVDAAREAKTWEGSKYAIGDAVRLATGLTLGGAALTLARDFLKTGNLHDSVENPGDALLQATTTGMAGQFWMLPVAAFGREGDMADVVGAVSMPAKVVGDLATAAKKAMIVQSADPLVQMAIKDTTAAKYTRDFLAAATSLEVGVAPAARRKAVSRFYDFAKNNPELMSSPIQPGRQTEVTKLGEAIRKIVQSKNGDVDAIVAALNQAGIEGKDRKYVARQLKAKMTLNDFKKDTRWYAQAMLYKEIGPSAYHELMMYDDMLEYLAKVVD